MNSCLKCDKQTKNPKFCSRSCSNSWNNEYHPKRKLTKKCKVCLTLIKREKTYCHKCYIAGKYTKKKIGVCTKHGQTRCTNDKQLRCLKCITEATTKTRRKNKRKLVELFGGKCQICSYSRTNGALTFHHVDSETKSFSISQCGNTRAFSKLVEESKKCILICANCHQEIHEGIRDISHLIPGPIVS